jgi:hypothetical protein
MKNITTLSNETRWNTLIIQKEFQIHARRTYADILMKRADNLKNRADSWDKFANKFRWWFTQIWYSYSVNYLKGGDNPGVFDY